MAPIKFQCGNYGNSLSRKFYKNFVKSTFLLIKLLWEKFCEREFRIFPQCDFFDKNFVKETVLLQKLLNS